jgi:hypothetical protein
MGARDVIRIQFESQHRLRFALNFLCIYKETPGQVPRLKMSNFYCDNQAKLVNIRKITIN